MPGFFVQSSHSNHDRGGPGEWKKSGEGDKKSHAFPSHGEYIGNKTNRRVTAAWEKDGLDRVED